MAVTPWLGQSISIAPKKGASAAPTRNPRYDADVRGFLEIKNGNILVLSEDATFIKTVRAGVLRALQVKRDCVGSFRDPELALNALRGLMRAGTPIIVLADRLIMGKPCTEFIRMARYQFPSLKLIVVTYDTTREALALLFEYGVDHIVTKPVSVDTLIEKMAIIIEPQTKFNRLVQDARLHLEKGSFDKVLHVCNAIDSQRGANAVTHMLRGEALQRNGESDEALAEFEKAHQTAPQYLEPLKKLVDAHRGSDSERLLEYMLRLDNISPLNVERKAEIGKQLVLKNEVDAARDYFDKAVQYAQEEAKRILCAVLNDIAQATLDTAPDLSEKYFTEYFNQKGDDLTVEDMVAFNSFGIALRKQGKWQQAIKNYELALKVDPNDLRIMYNYALAHADGEQHAKASELYEMVLRRDPAFHKQGAVICFNIANSYFALNNMREARRFLSEALTMDPGHASSLKLMSRIK